MGKIRTFVSYPLELIYWQLIIRDIPIFLLKSILNKYWLVVLVVSQAYTVNLVEENVLRGNSAIIKCLIPSFVTEYVSVATWIISEGDKEVEISINDFVDVQGTYNELIILHLIVLSLPILKLLQSSWEKLIFCSWIFF